MKTFVSIAAALIMAIILPQIAGAATFDAAAGEITAAVAGNNVTITWMGIADVKYVEQYRISNKDGKGWVIRHPAARNSVSFDVYEGDRFQLVDANGKWLFISPEWCVSNYNSVKLKGVTCECSNPKGCALQVK